MTIAPPNTQATHTYAWLSVASLTLTGSITTLHHVYQQGFPLLIPGVVICLLPAGLLLWFTRTRNKGALWAYGLLNAVIIAAFGFVDGFLGHTLLFCQTLAYNVLLPLHGGDPKVVEKFFSLLPPAPVDVFYEATGLLTFFVSVLALYFGYKFLQGVWKNEKLS